jgi:hypothetical protein
VRARQVRFGSFATGAGQEQARSCPLCRRKRKLGRLAANFRLLVALSSLSVADRNAAKLQGVVGVEICRLPKSSFEFRPLGCRPRFRLYSPVFDKVILLPLTPVMGSISKRQAAAAFCLANSPLKTISDLHSR